VDVVCKCCRCLCFDVADVATLIQCCRCCVSMLQTFDVGCCVEEKGEEAPHVGCCMQHGSQHGRNIVATWSQHGGGEKKNS
jgi:hypothetical protein